MNRFVVLDGIRGIAALFVLTRHTVSFWHYSFFKSYLAVDLFFILSGFVIAFAYEEKLKQGVLTFNKFVLTRLIRLYPVYIVSLAASSLVLAHRLNLHKDFNQTTVIEMSYLISMTALFLPTQMAGSLSLFPVNSAYWSLLYELLSNFVYAALRPFLNDSRLLGVVIASEIMLIIAAYQHGSLDVGFYWGGWSIFSGFARSFFGVFYGILIYRHRDTIPVISEKLKTISPFLSIVFVGAILSLPEFGKYDAAVDIVLVSIAFPFLVVFASQGENKKLESALLILGSSSYPIYILHAPLGQLVTLFLNKSVSNNAPFSGILFVCSLITFSVLLEKKYDIPVRKYLTKKLIYR